MTARPRIQIAIPTVDGGERLARALEHVGRQARDAAATASVVIVDNAPDQAIHAVSQAAERLATVPIRRIHEPTVGIPFARNAAIRTALDEQADALIFLDDDEWPTPGWLEALMGTWQRSGADIVLGPAKGALPEDAPRWARTSGVFDKDRRLPDGAPIRTAYSYNTLLSRRALETLGPTFDPAFRYTGGSDHDYFKRATAAGLRSVWSPDALVYEEVPPERLTLSWVLKRGYRSGAGAHLSARRRLGTPRAVPRLALLTAANVGFAGFNLIGTVHPRLSWVEGLRRLGIAAGLVAGGVRQYEEYRPRR